MQSREEEGGRNDLAGHGAQRRRWTFERAEVVMPAVWSANKRHGSNLHVKGRDAHDVGRPGHGVSSAGRERDAR